MRRFSSKANAKIVFRQGSMNASYLMHLYYLFPQAKPAAGQEYVITPPSISEIKEKGKLRYNISFATLALPCFNELYESFYFEGKK